jgi:hypothetical protein
MRSEKLLFASTSRRLEDLCSNNHKIQCLETDTTELESLLQALRNAAAATVVCVVAGLFGSREVLTQVQQKQRGCNAMQCGGKLQCSTMMDLRFPFQSYRYYFTEFHSKSSLKCGSGGY